MVARCDLLIRNGLVFDGVAPGRRLDIAVSGGSILALAPNLNVQAEREIDADGFWITPGFLDIHTHYDLELEVDSSLSESVRHGVTTVVIGNCSLSATYGAPGDLGNIFSRVETLPDELIERWMTQAGVRRDPVVYINHLQQKRPVPNVGCLLGHSALRAQVMGLERSLSEPATDDELEGMRLLAAEALEAGCIGISVDMVHWHKVNGRFAGRSLPSHHARYREHAMLAELCRSRGAVFQAIPNPARVWSLFEILGMGVGIWRAPLRLTVLAALDMDVSPLVWRLYAPMLWLFNNLLGSNIRMQTLPEPFTVYSDGCLTPFFEEFSAGVKLNNCRTREQRNALWQDPSFRNEFARSWQFTNPRAFHRDFSRMRVISAPDQSLVGKSIAQCALIRNESPLQCFMTLLELYDQDLRWVACSANSRDDVRRKLMRHPHIFPGFSDAGAHCRNIAFFDSALTVLREAVSSAYMPVEKAVATVTSLPARWFNLDAGTITVGGKADIVLLNPDNLRNPVPEPISIFDPILSGAPRLVKRDPDPAVQHVFVGGIEVARTGEPLAVPMESRRGQVLTQQSPTASAKEALQRWRNRVNDDWCLPASADYWDVFLLKHQHPANVCIHLLAFLLMYLIPIASLASGNYWLLLLAPLSQLTGRLGHLFFEDNFVDPLDGVFSFRAIACLHRMFALVLVGRYFSEVRRAVQMYPMPTTAPSAVQNPVPTAASAVQIPMSAAASAVQNPMPTAASAVQIPMPAAASAINGTSQGRR